jgi:hypothetical protein
MLPLPSWFNTTPLILTSGSCREGVSPPRLIAIGRRYR